MNATPQAMTIPQVLGLPEGTAVPMIHVKFKKIGKYTADTNEHGKWSFQNCWVTDGVNELKVKMKNRDELTTEWEGVPVEFKCREGKKKGTPWVGCRRGEDTYREKSTPCLIVDDNAEVTQLTSFTPARPEERPPVSPAAPAQQEMPKQPEEPAPQAPAPHTPPTPAPSYAPQSPHTNGTKRLDAVTEAKIYGAKLANVCTLGQVLALRTKAELKLQFDYEVDAASLGGIAGTITRELLHKGKAHDMPSTPVDFRDLLARYANESHGDE